MNYTYLLVDFFTIIVPLVFSFHPKLKFYQTWRAFFPAVIITGIAFVVWDIYFTKLGVWGFNSTYLLGIFVSNLPIEELLFFLCIPYSCVFTYHCLILLLKLNVSKQIENIISTVLILIGLAAAVCYWGKLYTSFTAILLVILLLTSRFLLKVEWLGKFYFVYLILLVPFCIVNGILTGTGLDAPVVWYNPSHIVGVRLMTIPIEDVFYGMDLILINLLIYKYLKSNAQKVFGPTTNRN